MAGNLPKDKSGITTQAFPFRKAQLSGVSMSPTSDTLIHIGQDTTITLDTVPVPFIVGDKITLIKGKTYGFSPSIPIGVS